MDKNDNIHESDDEETDDKEHESDDEATDDKELAALSYYKNLLSENKLNYEAHVGVIKTLRNLGELEELRKAHETMNEIYPLSTEIWLSWLSDEQKICESKEERKFVIELFQRSTKEYISVQIWVEYIMFMLGGGNMVETRQVCEEALTAVGIHLAEGILVWQAVSLVEQQFFLSLSPEEEKEIEEQRKRIQNIYRRQARVPLMNLDKEEFLVEVGKWFEGKVDPQIKRDLNNSYKKMLEKLPFEESLLKATDETEKLEVFRRYIDHVRKNDNPAVIQNIYERTVTELCLNSGIWEEYVRFVMEQFSSAHYAILPVCERSQANCPWSSSLFELHVNALEMFADIIGEKESKTKIKSALEKTLSSGIINEIELVNTWMAYLVYLRRQIRWDEETSDLLKEFREACQRSVDFIDEKLEEEGSKLFTISRFQARIEAELARDMEAARVIWNEHIMKRNNNFRNASLWIEFINLERSYGDEKHCRKLCRRALERVWTDVEAIGSTFLQFEQEVGTFETMSDFNKRYKDRLMIVLNKRREDAMKEEKKEGSHKFKGKGKEAFQELPTTSKIVTKANQPVESKKKDSPTTVVTKGKKRGIMEVDEVPADAPPGYFKSTSDGDRDAKRPRVIHGEFVEHDSALDYRTVFLSNMDYNANEDEVLDVFNECGAVDTFRLARDFQGRSKGYGYLIFKDGASVQPALSKDRTPVGNRPLFISRCNPKNRDNYFKFPTTLEKEKLFVRGLPFSMKEEEVKKAFEPHGKIKSLRLVTQRNGYSKGTCYIEYYDPQTAESVRQKMDGTLLETFKISVMISNPSAKKTEKREQHSSQSRFLLPPSRQRTKLSFVPRALRAQGPGANTINGTPSTSVNGSEPSTSNGAEPSTSNGTLETTSKSNEDFRNMLLKK